MPEESDEDDAPKEGNEEEKGEEESRNPVEVKQVIGDEENETGLLTWRDFLEFFNYSFGGTWGIVLVFIMHAIINGCTMAVSLYLAFSLTH